MSDQIAIWTTIVIMGAFLYATGHFRGYNQAWQKFTKELKAIQSNVTERQKDLEALVAQQKAFIGRLKKK